MSDPFSPRLQINFFDGEASVVFPPAWKTLYPLLRVDILDDLIIDLQKEHAVAREEMNVPRPKEL